MSTSQPVAFTQANPSAPVVPSQVVVQPTDKPLTATQDVCCDEIRDQVFAHLPAEAQALKQACKQIDQSHYYNRVKWY